MFLVKCGICFSELILKCQAQQFHFSTCNQFLKMGNLQNAYKSQYWNYLRSQKSLYIHLIPTCCSYYCTTSNKNNLVTQKRETVKKEFKAYFNENKERFRDTEQRIKQRGHNILQDIKDTKHKVKVRVGEIIEKENIYTIPNFLCVARMLISPYLGLLIIQADFSFALGLLGVAAFTDLLDGWIARTWESQSSKMGSFLDPLADKILIATLFLSLTYAGLIPIALTSLIIARDIILVAAGFAIRYSSLPPPLCITLSASAVYHHNGGNKTEFFDLAPEMLAWLEEKMDIFNLNIISLFYLLYQKTLSRYFDATHATAQLAPTFISKVNTAMQLVLVGSTLAAPVFHYVGHPALESLWYITAGTTIAAGLSYILSKNTYKYLKNRKS